MNNHKHIDLGFFGNIWVRQNIIENAGDFHSGHKHYFDHVTLLTSGSVSVSVDGEEPKTFTAPTFIVIRKESKHIITALTDDVNYYCVFALRNIDGEVIEDIFGEQHDPKSSKPTRDNYWENVNKIDI
jgi:hypothetical protein